MSNLTIFILTSIFILLSLCGFYFLIKNWSKFHVTLFGKVLKLIYILILLIAITVSGSIAYLTLNDYWDNDRLRIVNELKGFRLGWSKDEVYFRKGEPTTVDVKNDITVYLNYGSTRVYLENNKVVKVHYVCNEDEYEKVGGVSCNSDIDRVIKLYGEPKDIAISNDKLSRIYNYPRYNLAFLLTKSKVEMLAIFDSTKVSGGFKFSTAINTDHEKVGKWIETDEDAEIDEPAQQELWVVESQPQAQQDHATITKEFGGREVPFEQEDSEDEWLLVKPKIEVE